MKSFTRSLCFNSSVAFVLAGFTAITLHELSHLTAGKLLGEKAVLYANAVDFGNNADKLHQILTAATGPLFSLGSGLLLLAIAKRWGKGFWRLYWMWLGLISTQIAAGYFIIAPFARNGDTGKVLELLNVPGFLYYLSAAIGVFSMLWLARQFARYVVRYSDGTVRTMRPFGIYSWLIGTGLLMFAYIFAVRSLPDADQIVCLSGVFTAGIFAPMFSFFWRKLGTDHEELKLGVPVSGILLTIVAAIIVVGVLASGITV